jgi:hypothetical protein
VRLTLHSIQEILEPLAIANNVTQATHTRIDHVTITLGNLYKTYNKPQLEEPIRMKILGSLEKRWAAADQDVFILSVVFNPWIRTCAFNCEALTRMQLIFMADRVFKRLFEMEPDFRFMSQFTNYCDKAGAYSNEAMVLPMWKRKAEDQVRVANYSRLIYANFVL